jgi:3-phosphoshikimate 1-carboxyvinyltransferase
MIVSIAFSQIKGKLIAPSSKSSMQRACAAALVRVGKTIIHHYGKSDDDLAAIAIIEKLGATVERRDDDLIIISKGIVPINNTIHFGESGLSARLFTSLAALSHVQLSMTGEGSLLERPMRFFDDQFPELGVKFHSQDGKLPFQIEGPMIPKDIEIEASLSSQFLTGLLFAYSAVQAKDVTITVNDLKSKPYIDLTLDVMSKFGMKVPKCTQYESYYFDKETVIPSPNIFHYSVEGDWSGAAFLLVAAAISGTITVEGLDVFSKQADTKILTAIKECGCILKIDDGSITVSHHSLQAFCFDATDCPDLFPPLVALASYCKGKTIIKGTSRLIHKESNRAITLKDEFGKMGILIDLIGDEMIVHGVDYAIGNTVDSHNDHRIAMACAVAALRCKSVVEILNAEAIHKSYPHFYQDLKDIGANISEIS